MKNIVETDIAIVGGGIAGLWLLNRLRQAGFSVILLESATLGGGQTNKAQGIIHGGMKYALQGMLTSSAQAIAAMPGVWKQCLAGKGDINLTNVPILSQNQYLWSTGALSSKLAGFFAGIALKSNMRILKKEEYPAIFRVPLFNGQVYSLDEMVIDVHALVRELLKPNQDAIFKIDTMQEDHIQLDEQDRLCSFKIQADPMPMLQVKAQRYIFAGGSGNVIFLKKLKTKKIGMQLRPLRMVVVKHDYPYPLYAHCLGLGATPRLTITSHQAHDGKPVWYIGGQIAEDGVKRTDAEQVNVARKELKELFPWLDFSKAEFVSFEVNRAKNVCVDGGKPDSCFMQEVENSIVTWPIKMALAPKLADDVVHAIKKSSLEPRLTDLRELRAWPMPALAKPIWDILL